MPSLEIGENIAPVLTPDWVQNDAGPIEQYRLLKGGTTIYTGPIPIPHTDALFQLVANVTYQGAADYAEGPIKNDSDGNPYPTGRIPAGTITSPAVVYEAQRRAFFGALTGPAVPDAALIRLLTGALLNPVNGSVMVVNVPNGARGACFAYPLSVRAPTSIMQVSINIDVKAGFTGFSPVFSVQVPGANGFVPVDYRVIYIITEFPFGGAGETFT